MCYSKQEALSVQMCDSAKQRTAWAAFSDFYRIACAFECFVEKSEENLK